MCSSSRVYRVHSVQCTQCTVYTVYSVHSVQFTECVYIVLCTEYSLQLPYVYLAIECKVCNYQFTLSCLLFIQCGIEEAGDGYRRPPLFTSLSHPGEALTTYQSTLHHCSLSFLQNYPTLIINSVHRDQCNMKSFRNMQNI